MTSDGTPIAGLPDTGLHRALSDPHRAGILGLLRSGGPRDARALGRAVGLHPNTVRAHLAVLLAAGLVWSASAPPAGPGRPRRLYRAADAPSPEPPGGYREPARANPQPAGTRPETPAPEDVEEIPDGRGHELLARILASHLAGSAPDPAAAAQEAGREWGRFLAPKPVPFGPRTVDAATDRVVDLLAGLGFMPEAQREGDGVDVLLHRCPFRAAALANQTVVCGVHLGLLEGALTAMDAPLRAAGLEPWVEPDLCVARLEGIASGVRPTAAGGTQ